MEKLDTSDIRSVREWLNLTSEELAKLLGFEGTNGKSQISHIEHGRRSLRPAQKRLLQAYLDGYRPDDWPHDDEDSEDDTY